MPTWFVSGHAASFVTPSAFRRCERLKRLHMHFADQIRCWRRVGLFSLICLGMNTLATAQTEPPTPPRNPAQPSATQSKQAAKAKHSTSAPAATAHNSTQAAHKSKTSHVKKGSKQVAKKRGQQAIDSERAREIQTALIREHYMDGDPSGSWDSSTQAAMQRYQADQGWQSRTIPDARALIKLGLGPSHDHLLNPESAMTTTTTTHAAPGDTKGAANPTPVQNDIPQQ
jgi:hypothetical protein